MRITNCDPTSNMNYRPGLLFQLGTRNVAGSYVYKEILVYEPGADEPVVYDGWVFLNIVSEHDGLDPPLAPNDAFGLYPNNSTVLGPPSCPLTPGVAGGCNRNRCITSSMEDVKALITYWQGANGWKASAVQTRDLCSGNTVRFSFLDPFRVEVYQPADPLNGSDMGMPIVYASVDSIVVAVSASSPEKGVMQPIPFEFP
jgi:hypothetical protein